MTREDFQTLFHHAAEIQRYIGIGRDLYVIPPELSGWSGNLLNLKYLASFNWTSYVQDWPVFLDGKAPVIGETWNRVPLPILPLPGILSTSAEGPWKTRARVSDDEISAAFQRWYDFIVPQTCILLDVDVYTEYHFGHWCPETGEVFGEYTAVPIGTASDLEEAFRKIPQNNIRHDRAECSRQKTEILGDVEKKIFRLETADIHADFSFYGPMKGTAKLIHDDGEIVWTNAKSWTTAGTNLTDGYSWTITFDSDLPRWDTHPVIFWPDFT